MICEHCKSEMTPMITSWFCAACDTANTATRTARMSSVPGYSYDSDLIDEDPGPDCLAPDFYNPYVETKLYINDLAGSMRGLRRKDRQCLLSDFTSHSLGTPSLGTPADIAAERAVYPEWRPSSPK